LGDSHPNLGRKPDKIRRRCRSLRLGEAKCRDRIGLLLKRKDAVGVASRALRLDGMGCSGCAVDEFLSQRSIA
jgi:hypothetical protein